MKRILVGTLAVVGTIAALLVVAERMHFGERHVRAGNFDIYSSGKFFPDSGVSSSLYYGSREPTNYLNGYAVDPNNADRVVFSSDDHYKGDKSVCGTFLYDGRTGRVLSGPPARRFCVLG